MVQIVVDGMGSDNFPAPDVEGAVVAARRLNDVAIILVGDESALQAELDKHDTAGLNLTVRHASQAVAMTDSPSNVLKNKPDSSMHVGIGLVKTGEADAFVTAGNTGAVLAIAMLRRYGLGRIPGVKRPALGITFPVKERPFLIDGGANADSRPEHLLQFALMGSLYVERALGITNPRIGLIANGEEAGKGSSLVRETYPLLAQSGLNFIGNVEPKEFTGGRVDVAVTDGFTGNIILKMSEAIAKYIRDTLRAEIKSSPVSMVGGALVKPAFARAAGQLSSDETGGAPLLGVNGVVIIGHGRSNANAIFHAVKNAKDAVENRVVEAIQEGMKDEG